MRARSELLNALGEAGREPPGDDRKSRKRSGSGRQDRGAPTAVIEGDCGQVIVVRGNLILVTEVTKS